METKTPVSITKTPGRQIKLIKSSTKTPDLHQNIRFFTPKHPVHIPKHPLSYTKTPG